MFEGEPPFEKKIGFMLNGGRNDPRDILATIAESFWRQCGIQDPGHLTLSVKVAHIMWRFSRFNRCQLHCGRQQEVRTSLFEIVAAMNIISWASITLLCAYILVLIESSKFEYYSNVWVLKNREFQEVRKFEYWKILAFSLRKSNFS